MDRLHHFRLAAYVIALLLMAFPVVDLVNRLRPLELASYQWRFGALGLLAGNLLLPSVGLLLAAAVATASRQRALLGVLAGLSWMGALLITGAAILFALDFVESRTLIAPEAMGRFQMTSAIAFAKFGIFFLLAALLGWNCSVSGRSLQRSGKSERTSRVVAASKAEASSPQSGREPQAHP